MYNSPNAPFLLIWLYPLIVFPITDYHTNKLHNKLKQKGIKLEAKLLYVSPAGYKQLMQVNCKVNYNGIDTVLYAQVGAIRKPWKSIGKNVAALYLADENFLALMLTKKDSLKFKIEN